MRDILADVYDHIRVRFNNSHDGKTRVILEYLMDVIDSIEHDLAHGNYTTEELPKVVQDQVIGELEDFTETANMLANELRELLGKHVEP